MKGWIGALADRFEEVIASGQVSPGEGAALARSREGRVIRGFRFGNGPVAVSLLAGCHADEPIGPRLLRHLTAYLSSLSADDPCLQRFQWWIVPHINPDGELRNASWAEEGATEYDVARYLAGAVRELPGDDVEFGFPRSIQDTAARAEPRGVYDWWRSGTHPFALHVSLHSTAFAAGPWFLIEPAWRDRCEELKRHCRDRVAALGYVLHDVERHGEKGFHRLERGFSTRPDSESMCAHFNALGDSDTAMRFRPSSMETIRSLGGDPLTLVSEMPLFLTPGVGESLGPPDPVLASWRTEIERWRSQLGRGRDPDLVTDEAHRQGLTPMPVLDQMNLQWTLVLAGLATVAP